MGKSLYNEYEAENLYGQELDGEVVKLIQPLVDAWYKEGFSMIEIGSVIHSSIDYICSVKRVMEAIKKKRG